MADRDGEDDKKGGNNPIIELPLEVGDAVMSRNTIDRGDGLATGEGVTPATTNGGGGDCPNLETAAAISAGGGGDGDGEASLVQEGDGASSSDGDDDDSS